MMLLNLLKIFTILLRKNKISIVKQFQKNYYYLNKIVKI